MSEYVKINSLWKRQGWYFGQDKKNSPDYQKGRQSFIIGDYACPEFGNIKYWNITEKVDGTNIRISLKLYGLSDKPPRVEFAGRTDKATIQPNLLRYLQDKFSVDLVAKACGFYSPQPEMNKETYVMLYGEGYGSNIQAAGPNYRKDPSFILFDVVIGNHWLNRESVKDIASKLDVPCVPDYGLMTEDEVIDFVKQKSASTCSEKTQTMEGIVARSEPMVYFRDGRLIMFKLKCNEFV
jgi:hypothetical protein